MDGHVEVAKLLLDSGAQVIETVISLLIIKFKSIPVFTCLKYFVFKYRIGFFM